VLRKSVGIALIDQAVLSLFNLGLNLMLIALAAPSEFGRYIYASAVLLVCTSLQNALVNTPLAVLVPGRPADEQARVVQGLLSFDVPFRIACAVVAPILCMLTDYSLDFLVAVAVCVYAALGRETWRTVALAFENPAECLRIDAVSVLVSLVATAAIWWVLQPAVACIAGVAIGNFAGAVLARQTRQPQRLPMLAAITNYRAQFWGDTQWSLMGAGTTELQYRSYVFTLEFFRETAVLAAVQAGRLLLGPLALVVGAWGKVARPAMARQLAENDPRGMMALTASGMVYVLSVAACYCAALYLLWPLAERWIFKGRYDDIGLMTVAWGGYMMVVIAHMVLSVPLQAAMQLKELAQVTIATACLTCVMLLSLALPVPPVFAVVAMTIGEVVALLWILVLVLRLADTRQQRPDAPLPGNKLADHRPLMVESAAAVGVSGALARAEP
jgi:O-antigen/teichoic acid export membrane protein